MSRREPHPSFAALLERCRSRPRAHEDRVLGETVFRVDGRVFAFLGRRDRPAVTVKATADAAAGLLRLPYVRRARYVGRFGWLVVEASEDASLDLALALIDRSYRLVASRRTDRSRD